jgi:endonuclease-3
MLSRKERFEGVIGFFKSTQPVAETELAYTDPYELIVAVILSAQCTDKRVNMITPAFYKRFPSIEALAAALQEEVFEYIRTCSYPNNKAKHLIGMARTLLNDFGGKIPSDVDELRKLPGVGRKTANVVASVIFHQPAMAVDTHVFRVSARIGLTWRAKNPYDAEKQLVAFIPRDLIPVAHHWLILHGRYVCTARKPKCPVCGLTAFCKYYQHSRNLGNLSGD